MKKLKALFHSCEDKIEERWQKLSAKKQKKFVIIFFAGYLLVSTCVIATVWYDAKTETNLQKNVIEHIQNPILKQGRQLDDSSSIIRKK